MDPLKLYTELGKAAAQGVGGEGFQSFSRTQMERATCFTGLNSGDIHGTIHLTEAAAITRTPGPLICCLRTGQTRESGARQAGARGSSLITYRPTGELTGSADLTRVCGFNCPSLPPPPVPLREQTRRKQATLSLGFHSCPRLTLQPRLPGKLIKKHQLIRTKIQHLLQSSRAL